MVPRVTNLADKVAFLSDPGSYSGGTSHVTARETHMSWVFLTDRRVYKLKKPVRYPFLDFSTLEKRRFYCEEELRLNRRLAQQTYLSILPLSRDVSGALTLSGPGRVVEWLVEMKRLPQTRMLDAMICQGRVDEDDIGQIGELLADFYVACTPEAAHGAAYLEYFIKEQAINRSVLHLDELEVSGIATAALDAVDDILQKVLPELEDRIRRGRLIEGHGDLRPEHVCLVEPPQIIDCLEFNRWMRLIDPFDEVNYLGMECEMSAAPWVRPLLLRALEMRLTDPPSRPAFAFYGAFRALLRARLCLAHLLEEPPRHAEKWRPLAIRYIAMAEREVSSLESEKV
jgi:aminoglycoside phosphotransferase family enzyme